jgi:amino acid permease
MEHKADTGDTAKAPTSRESDGNELARSETRSEGILVEGLLDDRYNTTKRGLQSRHAQMIALGGTIRTSYESE